MEENINISEKIDRYILGQMNEVEKAVFEAELSADSDLKHEYELQREIILAIQRVHFKRHLQNIEQQAIYKRRKTIKRVSALSIAASIVCVCVLGVDIKWSSNLKDAANLSYIEIGAPSPRSSGEIDGLLLMAYNYIGESDYENANSRLDAAEAIINERLLRPVITEEDAYRKEILILQKQDAEWYRVLILMKDGEIFKIRKTLKRIANSDSRYADEARNILETNYPF